MPLDVDYRPDFYLPKYGIYLEYFGIDEEGNTLHTFQKTNITWKCSGNLIP